MSEFNIYLWILLPVLIFLARVADVTLGTIRVIFISKGLKYFASAVGFFEILIWLVAIGQIMKNLSNPVCYIAYAGGFAMGNFVGIWIADKLSLGLVMIRVITRKNAAELVEHLKTGEYGVTSVNGQGAEGNVKIVFTITPRRQVSGIVKLIKKFNPKAFYSIEEVGFVEKGVFPAKEKRLDANLKKLIRPFRKAK